MKNVCCTLQDTLFGAHDLCNRGSPSAVVSGNQSRLNAGVLALGNKSLENRIILYRAYLRNDGSGRKSAWNEN